ncbi:MAG: right-handed parallel beta-helix repeat-containing protein [Candidatus Hodarchaeales archaeon]|jgi:parallel beta-helix repeat protein
MNNQRKVIFSITPILLILCFSALTNLSSNRLGGSNPLSVSLPTVNDKLTGIQGINIVIIDNNGFSSSGFTGYGNETHPYVLDGNSYGKIEAGGPSGIDISDTDAYFRIENMLINGSIDGGAGGIKLTNVINGKIVNTNVTNSYRGFYLVNTNQTSITESRAIGNSDHGFVLTGYCSFNNLTSNTAENNSNNGFLIYYHSNNNLLKNNIAINNTSIGYSLYLSHNNTLLGNIAKENVFGYNLWNFCSFNNLTGNLAENNSENGFVMLSSSNNNFYKGNIAINNTDDGFWLYNVDSNKFLENEVAKNGENGFSLDNASFNTFLENDATKTGRGFYLWDSSNNSFTNNTVAENYHGFFLNTTCNDNNLTQNVAINNTSIGFFLYMSHNNTLLWNIAKENTFGFDLWHFCSFNNLTGNLAANNSRGYVHVGSSINNLYKGNLAINNTEEGFRIINTDSNIFIQNEVAKNGLFGFELQNTSYNTFLDNTVTNTGRGFRLWDSSNNSFTKNSVVDNDYGFDLDTDCNDNNLTYNVINGTVFNAILLQTSNNNNTLTWNTIEKTGSYGVKLDSSNDNLIYYNFFLANNGGNTQSYDGTLTNSWDNGTHGNYWSDYTGNDLGNGIGNINYTTAGQSDNDTKPLVFTLTLTGPGDLTFEAGSTGEAITWIPNTLFPLATTANSFYAVYQDKSQTGYGNWTSGGSIVVDLPVLGPGEYNFTVGITDSSGKTVVNTAIMTMIDTILPVIIYTGPDDLTYKKNTPGKTLNVSATDVYPHTYILYQNGTVINSSNWISGELIIFSLDDFSLPVGVYNFTIVVNDTSGNEATKTIIVTVNPADTTSTTDATTIVSTTSIPISTTTATTASSISPAWTAPFTLFTLAVMVFLLSGRRWQRNQ